MRLFVSFCVAGNRTDRTILENIQLDDLTVSFGERVYKHQLESRLGCQHLETRHASFK